MRPASLCSTILPDVGRAMQPMSVMSVVLPEPLGPFSIVTFSGSMSRLTSLTATNWLALPTWKLLVMFVSEIISML